MSLLTLTPCLCTVLYLSREPLSSLSSVFGILFCFTLIFFLLFFLTNFSPSLYALVCFLEIMLFLKVIIGLVLFVFFLTLWHLPLRLWVLCKDNFFFYKYFLNCNLNYPFRVILAFSSSQLTFLYVGLNLFSKLH